LNRLRSFRACGQDPLVYYRQGDPAAEKAVDRADEFVMRGSWCHDRFCAVCSGAKARDYGARTAAVFKDQQPLFITLTIAGTMPLAEGVKKLYDGFKQLRRLRVWSDRVRGGVAFLEVKRSAKAGRWHPHLHILALGQYLPQAELQEAWHAITKDSFRVDVRRATTAEGAGYACKYAGKPMNTSFSGAPALLQEAILALRGRRLVTPFGTLYHAYKDLDNEHSTRSFDEGWAFLGNYNTLVVRAGEGDELSWAALRYLEAKRRRRASIAESHGSAPPPAPLPGL